MRHATPRLILFALLLTWALSHASAFGGGTKGEKGRKDAKDVTPIERIRQTLDQPMTLDFSGQSIQEALQHLREKTGIDFNLDQLALAVMGININDNGDQPVTLKSSGSKLSASLRKMLSPHQLAYVVYEDSVLITTNEMATHRQMKQRVSLDVEEVPLAKALRELARNYAFNLVIDPKVIKDANKPVSLTLDGTNLETSVRLLAEMAGLKAVRMDNVLFVTTEERAEKIRKEEKDLIPNPLEDPNLPGIPKLGALQLGGFLGGPITVVGPAFKPVPLPAKDSDPDVLGIKPPVKDLDAPAKKPGDAPPPPAAPSQPSQPSEFRLPGIPPTETVRPVEKKEP